MNERGQVAGSAYTKSDVHHAFLWDPVTGMTDLGTLGGGESFTRDMNERGQVAGVVYTKSDRVRAFLWDPAAGMTDLGTLGGSQSSPMAVNDRGQVVGWAQTKSGDAHAFLWDPAAGMTDLGTLGGPESSARAVNERGQVTGLADTRSGRERAFLWDPVTGMTDLGTLGGDESDARDVNERGQVVGWAETKSGDGHAFLWDPTTGMTDLGTLRGPWSDAWDVNERGQVAGMGYTKSGRERAFLWDPVTGMTDLGTLGGPGSVPNAVNERGQVVGWAYTKSHDGHGFLWEPVTGITDLGTSGGRESSADAVNDRGQVAGQSGGVAVLWTPSTLAPRVRVQVSRNGAGNSLSVNVNPNRGPQYWAFRVQKRTTSGSWSSLPGTYRTKGKAETRTLTLGRGVFRVKVLARYGYKGTTSEAVRLIKPTVQVKVRAVSHATKLFVNVNPNRSSGSWTFRVQKRTRSGSWSTLPGTYRTKGKAETRTLTLGRGVFRVKVLARYGYKGTTSEAVRLIKPTVQVKVRAVSDATKLFVDVDPNRSSGSWRFRVQYRRSNHTWYTLPTTFKTFGPSETNTINLRRGTYRILVKAQHGHKRATSTPVRIAR